MIKKIDEKKEVKEKVDQTKKINVGKKQNLQLIWIVGLMAAIIVIIIVVPIIKHELFDKFDYMKLSFEKTITGDTIFYTTNIPVVEQNIISGDYLIYFRNDPRELENISVEEKIEDDGGIKFIKKNTVYISIDPYMTSCDENSVALFVLGSFLKDFGLNVKSGFSDPDYIKSDEFPYINCEHSKSNTVIKITSGDETKIDREIGNCYVITYKDCEIQKGVEKFILLILEDYMDYFEKAN